LIPPDLHFAYLKGFYLFPVAFLILLLMWGLIRYRRNILASFFNADLISEIEVPRSQFASWGKVAACFLLWIFAMLAFMQPEGNGRYPLESGVQGGKKEKEEGEATARRKAHDVIFLVDASASMSVKDTRTGVSRLEYAKEIVDEVVSRLRGESVALYAFTSDTTRLSPTTMDYLFVRLVLRDMDINEGDIAGTNMIEALSDMRDAYFSKQSPKLKTLVVITDGEDTELAEMQGNARDAQEEMILSLIPNAADHQLRVFTVGMGTENGDVVPGVEDNGKPVVSKLDEKLLKALSQKGRGDFYLANQWTALDLADDLIEKMGEEEPPLEEFTVNRSSGITRGKDDLVYDLYFQFPLAIALLMLLWVLFFPETRALK